LDIAKLLRFVWQPRSNAWRAATAAIVLAGATIAVVATNGPSATIQPVSVNGRTWLPIARGAHSSLILANGISGLVEAGGENEAVDLPTNLSFAGSSAAATVLQSPLASVVITNDTHRETLLDIAPGSHSLLSGEAIVSFGAKASVHRLTGDSIGLATDVVLDGGTIVDAPPVADAEGRVWTLMTGPAGPAAITVSPDNGTATTTNVSGDLGTLIVVDGLVYHASASGITPLSGGKALASPGAGGIIPTLAVATAGIWAVANATVVTVTAASAQQTITAPGDITAMAIWHGNVWITAGGVLYKLANDTFSQVASLHDAARPYLDGGRMWFVGTDTVVSVDDRQNAVVFDLSSVDIALCIQTCSAADAARYIEDQPKTTAGSATTEPPSRITLPPVLPTPPPTSPVTQAPVTVTPPTTQPPATAPPATQPAEPETTRAVTAAPTHPAVIATIAAPVVEVTNPPATVQATAVAEPTAAPPTQAAPTDPAVILTDPRPLPTVPLASPRPTRPARPNPTAPPTEPATVAETAVADTAVAETTAPADTTPPTATGQIILAFTSGDDPLTGDSTTIAAGWAGDANSCFGGIGVGTLSWSGAGSGSQLVQLNFGGTTNASINIAPGTLTVTFTVCGQSAQISRAVGSNQPAIGNIGFSPPAPQPGQSVQASASINNVGWRVVGASWLGGVCAQGTASLASSFNQTSTSATLQSDVPGPYCVTVIVSFAKSGNSTTANGQGQVVIGAAATTPPTGPASTTPGSTTTTVVGTPTTPAPTTTAPATTAPATTAPAPTTTAPAATTTKAPPATTAPAPTTTAPPATTKASPATTTAPPTTTKAPPTTTKAPATTTKAPTTTTKAPVATTKAPPTT